MNGNAKRSCHFERGQKSEVAIVLSCPGRREQIDQRPASGTTGRNLELLLEKLGLHRSDVTITNAHTGVEYTAGTGRSEASIGEVVENENIKRLSAELEDTRKFVIFCGDRAHAVADLVSLREGTKKVYLPHLGMQGINQIGDDIHGISIHSVANSKIAGDKRSAKIIGRVNTLRRLDVLAQRVYTQIQ